MKQNLPNYLNNYEMDLLRSLIQVATCTNLTFLLSELPKEKRDLIKQKIDYINMIEEERKND